jgi:hypothetical protein
MKLNNNLLLLSRETPGANPVSGQAGGSTHEEVRMNDCLKLNSMKVVAVRALALCLALTALSAESPQSPSPPRLAGIVSVGARPCAVLEITRLHQSAAKWFILSEGQREEDVEVMKIAPDKGSVEVARQGTNRTTVRLNDTTNLPVPGIVLEDVGLNEVLQLFAQFTNRSLLRWPDLPATSFSLRAAAKDRVGAARILEKALVAEDLSIIPDGEKFLMIVPKAKAATVKPHAPSAKAATDSGNKTQAAAPGSGGTEQEPLMPGLIDFRSADVAQVADVYAIMLGRKLDLSGRLPAGGTISLTTQTPLTKEEGVYALETLLHWSGIKLVPVGEDKLKAVRDREY